MRTMLTVLAFVSLASRVFGGPATQWHEAALDQFMGTNYSQRITHEQAPTLPSWNPESEPCPLSANEAIRIARARITTLFPQATAWKLSSFSLHPLHNTDKWVYRILFKTDLGDGFKPPHNSMSVVVALNGWTPDIEVVREAEESPNTAAQSATSPAGAEHGR